jgi:hypothetical protein
LIQQGWPIDRELDGCAGLQFVVGGERHSPAAHIDGVTGAGGQNPAALHQFVPQLAPYAEPASGPAFPLFGFYRHFVVHSLLRHRPWRSGGPTFLRFDEGAVRRDATIFPAAAGGGVHNTKVESTVSLA